MLEKIPDLDRFSSGCPGFDRVLGGGLVCGSTTLLRGEPGVGKTTLLARVARASRCGPPPRRVLLVSGEQRAASLLKMLPDLSRAQRTLVELLCDERGVDARQIADRAKKIRAALVVVDSLQTISATDLPVGGRRSEQVRVVDYLRAFAQESGAAVIITSHTNKKGGTTGGERAAHAVDAVLDFVQHPDAHCAQRGLRVLRAARSRYGPHAVASLFLLGGGVCVDTCAVPD